MQILSKLWASTARGMTIVAAAVVGAFAGAALAPHAHAFAGQLRLAAQGSQPVVQDDSPADDDDKEPTPAQVQKYIDVYKSMQKDRNLTIEQATSKQGMTVAEFRKLEGQVERQDTIRERVRKALRNDSGKSTSSD